MGVGKLEVDWVYLPGGRVGNQWMSTANLPIFTANSVMGYDPCLHIDGLQALLHYMVVLCFAAVYQCELHQVVSGHLIQISHMSRMTG